METTSCACVISICYLRDGALAEDAAQETFVRAVLGLPGKYREVVVLYYCPGAGPAPGNGIDTAQTGQRTAETCAEGVVLCGVDIRIRPDLIVKVDGAVQSFANEKGEAVYPIVFEEMTYLPVRSIGGPCGKEVTWIAYSGGGEDIYLYAP